MAEDMDDIVENLRQPSAWIRILFMIAYAIVLYIVIAPLLLVLMLAQALFSVISGESNRNLRYLGSALIQHIAQILAYITYNSEQKPFPFSDFPSPEDPESADKTAARGAAKAKKKTATRKKTTAKKKPAADDTAAD